MESSQLGSNNAVDTRAASVRSDVIFSRGYGCRVQRAFPCKQDALAAVPR